MGLKVKKNRESKHKVSLKADFLRYALSLNRPKDSSARASEMC